MGVSAISSGGREANVDYIPHSDSPVRLGNCADDVGVAEELAFADDDPPAVTDAADADPEADALSEPEEDVGSPVAGGVSEPAAATYDASVRTSRGSGSTENMAAGHSAQRGGGSSKRDTWAVGRRWRALLCGRSPGRCIAPGPRAQLMFRPTASHLRIFK